MESEVVIVGAGPTGLMLAVELCLAGVQPVVLERHPEPRDVQKAGGFTDDTWLRRSAFSHAVVSAGREHDIIVTSDSDAGRAKFRELLPQGKHAISLFVCYCSVLGDCWTTSTGDTHDGDSDSGECPIRDAERFEE